MRDFKLNSSNPFRMTLAADARLSTIDYTNDQIWELILKGGEPPAVALMTTFGLRATQMRLFPLFTEAHISVTDPGEFSSSPVMRCNYPNFLEISYSPLKNLEVTGEYWCPNSNAIVTRTRITNTGSQSRQIQFEYVALLKPLEGGEKMIPQELEAVQVLLGTTGDLSPVVFITGGANAINSPYPALVHGLDLPPGKSRQFICSLAALSAPQESFSLARKISACNWDAERARIEQINSSQIEIFTGNSEWDDAFVLSQKIAHNLLITKSKNLPYTSFVTTRGMDEGYSYKGDGSDYGAQWNGQTPLDSYYLSSILLPSSPDLVAGFLLNFLNSFNEDGEIDWRPGLGGQLSHRLATPLLASLTWQIYQVDESKDFLLDVFPKLIAFISSWFTSPHDRDGDGIPEWDHPLQAGFEDHPVFARWHSWAQGVDIRTTESPSLCAFLYNECQVLIKIAKIINLTDSVQLLEQHARKLHTAIESSWNEQLSCYSYWDRDSHQTTDQLSIAEKTGSGTIQINSDYAHPIRLLFHIKAEGETTRKPQISIHGTTHSGHHRVEQITSERILWFPGWGTTSSEQIFISVEHVDIQGLETGDTVIISSAGLTDQDITTLLPLWAGIPSTERASSLIKNTILNRDRYWGQYGLHACPEPEPDQDHDVCQMVFLPWCLFIGEGLLSYGYQNEAAELVTRIMDAISASLEKDGCFRQYYNAVTNQGFGDYNGLWGLAPISLFLKTLGVKLISPWKVELSGINPYPWPVTVKYRGMTILRGLNKTQIVFPDGQAASIESIEPQIVSLE